MEPGQRRARYHPMAYIEEAAVEHLKLHAGPLDILLTHQGPSQMQGDHGSPTLDMLLDSPAPKFWFHGHSIPVSTPRLIGATTIVPLGDIAFKSGKPGSDGWAILEFDGGHQRLTTEPPPFLREMQLKFWHRAQIVLLVHPDLRPYVE